AREVVSGHGGGLAVSATSLGLFQSALIAFTRIAGSSQRLAMLWGSLQDVGVGLARAFEMLGKQTEHVARTPGVRPVGGDLQPSLSRGLSFHQVSFAYTRGANVFDCVDFEAQVGELTAVVGPSGAGKSTLIALLLRFFDPARGCILFDGHDIREFDLAQ